MPELPEVATMLDSLKERLIGARVGLVLAEPGLVAGGDALLSPEWLAGARVAGIVRRGKYARFDFAPGPARRHPGLAPAVSASIAARRPSTLAEALEGPAEKAGRSRPLSPRRARASLKGSRKAARPATPAAASLIVHLKMTGRFFMMNDNGYPIPRRTRFLAAVDSRDEHLLFGVKDTRRLARAWVLSGDEAHTWPRWLKLGPDALDRRWTANRLAGNLAGRLPIKLALLDQERLAGLGNIYAAELLFRAGIHPARRASSLAPDEWKRLAAEMPRLLKRALRRWCETSRWIGPAVEGYGDFRGEIGVYGRDGEKCRRCGSSVQTMTQAGRTTFYCGGCQR